MGSLLPICRAAADGVLAAFTWLPPLAGLLVLSGSLGVVLLVLFRFLSPQRRLRATKDQMAATVYEMRIFADSPRLVLLAALRSLRWLAQYFVLSLPALVVLFPLVGLLLVRAATHYDYRPLRVSEDALITLTLEQDARGQPIRVTSSSADLELLPPVVQVRSLGQVFARVRANKPGTYQLRAQVGQVQIQKSVQVGQRGAPLSPERTQGADLDLLLSQEPPLSQGAVKAISVPYPRAPLCWLGLPWYLLLLIISMAVAFALRGRLGVTF